jgi:multimeric flavodoxin WrbA
MNSHSKTAIILNGSPRRHGNTAVLVKWLEEALQGQQWATRTHNLYALNFRGCAHCDACKKVFDSHGCALRDDLNPILNEILQADLIVVASPIYCWATSGCMSAALERFYAFSKEERALSLLKGKKMLGAFTSGGDYFDGMELCVAMLKQLCGYCEVSYAATIAAANCTTPYELSQRSTLQQDIANCVASL